MSTYSTIPAAEEPLVVKPQGRSLLKAVVVALAVGSSFALGALAATTVSASTSPTQTRLLPAGGGVAAMMSQSGLAPPRAAPRLPGLETLATPGPGADRERAALDALLWQGMQELRDAYRALAPAPAPEKPSEGLNALALATQMEL